MADEEHDVELDEEEDEPGADGGIPRPFWSGTISFGLVSVPVDLYPANRPKRVSLRMLSPEGEPLARRYYDEKHDRAIDRTEIVRGYELDDGRMIVVTDDELDALEPEKSRDIDLRRFVPAQSIDARYFQRGYFLTPSEGSNKAYRLLAAVMEESDRAGIATFVMRGREYLIAIFSEKGILRAETLRFADELRSPADVDLPEPVKAKPAAVKKMTTAINKLKKADLAESELRDEWAERLLKLVAKKAKKGEDTIEVPAEARPVDTDVIDLMEVLKRSLQGSKERTSRRASSARKTSRPAARTTGGKGGDDLSSLSKEELYERAQERDIAGRSSMTKAQLVRALGKES